MYRFYIEGTLIKDEPVGVEDFVESLERDDVVRGLLIKYPTKLTFWGDGYKAIENIYQTNGYCSVIKLVIEQQDNNSTTYKRIFNGLIQFKFTTKNINKKHIECSVDDDNYGAKIFNNKKVKTFLTSTKSKGGVSIAPAAQIIIDNLILGIILDPPVADIKAFDIKECFRFLIDWMTDGTVGFSSDWLDNLPDNERISICRGIALRTIDHSNAPQISFEELFTEVNKKYNIGFVIENGVSGNPIMRIELSDTIFGSTPILAINNIEDLEQIFDTQVLYANVKLGSSLVSTLNEYPAFAGSLPALTLLTFAKEEYPLSGQCNIDSSLDLESKWIIDSNVIEIISIRDIVDFDDNIVMLQYDAATLTTPTTSYYYNASDPGANVNLYNEQLLNINVIERWKLEGDIAAYLANFNQSFKAFSTAESIEYNAVISSPITINPFQFSDDYNLGFDISNTFGNGTTQGNPVSQANSRYTSTSDGNYRYRTKIIIDVTNTDGVSGATFNAHFDFFDSAGGLIISFNGALNIATIGQFDLDFELDYNITGEGYGFTWARASYVQMRLLVVGGDVFPTTYTIKEGCFFSLSNLYEEYKTLDPIVSESRMISKFNFETGLSLTDWEAIKANPSGAIIFNHDGITNRIGWVRKIDRNSLDSTAKFELITNIANGN